MWWVCGGCCGMHDARLWLARDVILFPLQARARGDIKAPFVAVLRADKRTQQPMVAVTMMGGGGGSKRGSRLNADGRDDGAAGA